MKQLTILFSFAILFSSCGSKTDDESASKTMTIKTDDIEGTINANPDETSELTHNGDIKSKGKVLKFDDKGEISIYLTEESMAEKLNKIQGSPLYDKVEIKDQSDNAALLYIEKSFKEEVDKGFTFYVIKDYEGNKKVCLEGKGVEMFKPIAEKSTAEELMKVAQTFSRK